MTMETLISWRRSPLTIFPVTNSMNTESNNVILVKIGLGRELVNPIYHQTYLLKG